MIPLFVTIVCASGCGLFSSKTNDSEVEFAPTEVGTPEGDRVTKNIGPAGGTLASPDGRLTLTVPQNALTDTVAFSIQPITNKAEGGLGLAYRLEPNGKTFGTPLAISIHYDDHDLDGTVPEALSMAYQDQQGSWHAQKKAKLDQAAKTITIATTHFTDFSFLARLRMVPTEATLHVGEMQVIKILECKEPGFWGKLLSRPVVCDWPSHPGDDSWKLRGPGKIIPGGGGTAVYRAPNEKPTPNVVWVDLTVEFNDWNPDTGETSTIQKTFATKITIIDRGYRASGNADAVGEYVFSGVICDLDKPFTISSNNPLIQSFELVPSSPNGGTWKIAYGNGVMGGREGEYTVEGSDTEKTGILLNGGGTATIKGAGTGSGGPAFHLALTPLNLNECAGG